MLKRLVMPSALFLFYILLCGTISIRVILSGLVVTGLVTITLDYFEKMDHRKPLNHIAWWRIAWFFLIVLFEIFIAAYHHVIRVVRGAEEPVIFDVYLDVTEELAIALIANAITLTPGTLTIQVNENSIRVVGFAKGHEEVGKIASVIVRRFQRPFLYKRK